MFLSILIVANGFAISVATVLLVLDQDVRNSLGYFPAWFSPFLIVFLFARLIALYAIWNLRRWGVYAFLLLESLEVAMGLFVFTGVLTLPLRVMAVPSFLFLLIIWFLALRPKWHTLV